MDIVYKVGVHPTTEQIIELYENAKLPRPTHDKDRIREMFEHSNLVVTAWHNDLLVGVSRSITDWAWSCYLADLAIRSDYQGKGIGKKMIHITKEEVGERSTVLLLSVPTAMDYYPKAGLKKIENGFIIHRDK